MLVTPLRIGGVVGPVRVGRIAHGGHWVGRHDGRVLFIRHALEGESVMVRVTGLAKRHGFADAVEVLEASEHRIPAPCPIALSCGGCDFQHVDADHQRELKRQVVAEQLRRGADLGWGGRVEAPDAATLGWRTRMRYHRDPAARGADGADGWGMHAPRSHQIVALPDVGCALAVPELAKPSAGSSGRAVGETLVGVAAADGVRWVKPGADELVTEEAAGRSWQVSTDGFWQVHPRAASVLVDAVLEAADVRQGERALDLYCGVGLFAGAMVDAGAHVTGVEGGRRAIELARKNVPQATFHVGSVDRVLNRLPGRFDVVVLDPPRQGAGSAVLRDVLDRGARVVVYVACDPAALARDLATAREIGWNVDRVRAFDLFGSTHHVECVATLTPPRRAH